MILMIFFETKMNEKIDLCEQRPSMTKRIFSCSASEQKRDILKAQQETEKIKQEAEEKSKNVWRPSGRFSSSSATPPVQRSEETNIPPSLRSQSFAGKFVPRKEVVSSTRFSLSDSNPRGKYVPPREVVATAPYSAITKPKDRNTEEKKPAEKWVPPHRKK